MRVKITRRSVVVGAAASAVALIGNVAVARADQPKIHEVSIEGFAFVPMVLEVRVGDIIRWVNQDLAPHTATADARGWDSGEIAQGQSAEIEVTANMETTYFCLFHPHMKAEFVIAKH